MFSYRKEFTIIIFTSGISLYEGFGKIRLASKNVVLYQLLILARVLNEIFVSVAKELQRRSAHR